MDIVLGKTAGFCYGVNNAVTKAEEFVKNNKEKNIYCLGELVHNKQVVQKLEKEGLKFIEKLEEISKKDKLTVIIRAHGEPKSTYEFLKNNKIEILDLTCPNVLAIHKLVEEKVKDGFYIFLIGQKTHPETIGTKGFCDDNCSVIETKEDIELTFNKFFEHNKNKIFVVVQTTFSLEKFNNLCEIIKDRINDEILKNPQAQGITLEIRNTICNATRFRQEETEKLSKDVDYMIIIGGKNSSNTRKLYDIAAKNCPNTILVESVDELKEENRTKIETIKNLEKVGIMAGASTPRESIEEVITLLKKI